MPKVWKEIDGQSEESKGWRISPNLFVVQGKERPSAIHDVQGSGMKLASKGKQSRLMVVYISKSDSTVGEHPWI